MGITEDVSEAQEPSEQPMPAFIVRSTLVERYEAEHGPGSLEAFLAKHAPLSFPPLLS